MKTSNSIDRTVYCSRCEERKPKSLMSTKKFCCCLLCEEKGREAKLARQNESTAPRKAIPAHSVEHKKAMNNLDYMQELAAINDVNGHLDYE